MIRAAIRNLRPSRAREVALPYDMFDRAYTDRQVSAAKRLERIYHSGQDRAWDGKDVLAELVARHGAVSLAADKANAVRNLFAVILWGELAAWKVSAQLALTLEPLEAKMAATSQAHDEARHFYVMHDYLELLGYRPGQLPPIAARTLHEVLTANTLAKKLMGMQLMVEPIALTLFQLSREQRLEPVLCELLVFFERDEARHVALGINHLPELLRGMSRAEALDLWAWQLKMLELEMRGMAELEESFRCLGIASRDVLRLGMAKQLLAFRMMTKELGQDPSMVEVFRRYFEFRIELSYPEQAEPADLPHRFVRAVQLVFEGVRETHTELLTVPEI
jgi:hypothetical protein